MKPSPLFAVSLILLLWLAGLGAAAQFAKIAVPFPLVRAQFPEAGTGIGWLLTLISALGAALGIAAGSLVARFGCGRLLVLAMMLGGAVSLWQSVLPGLPVMMLSRAIEGLSHLIIVVAAPTLIALISPDPARGAFMALWSTFFGVAFALTAWFGLPFAISHGLAALFAAHGAYMLVLAAILAAILTARPVDAPVRTIPLAPGALLSQTAAGYRSAFIAAPAIGWLFYTLTFVALLTLLPDLVPPENRAWVTGLMPLASIAVSLALVPVCLTIMPAVAAIMLGFGLAALIIATLFVGAPVALVAIALFAALGLVQGASFAAVPELNAAHTDRALANGALAQMGNTGNLLGTPLLLLLLETTGNRASFAAIIGLYLLAVLAHLMLARARKSQAP